MATLENPLPKITAETLNSGIKPAAIPTPTPDTTPFNTIASSAVNSVMGDYTNLQAQQQAQEKAQTQSAQSQLDYMGMLGGKTADTQTANETAGVNEATTQQNEYLQQLANLNAQASSLQREAQAAPIQTTEENAQAGRVTTTGVAQGQTEQKLRQNALKALSIAQQSDIASAALTGSTIRLAQAKEKAQQIVDLKYKPVEDALAREKELYILNKDLLDRTDKKRSEALALAIKKDEEATAEKKANETRSQGILLNAQQGGAPSDLVAIVSKGISDGSLSPTKVTQMLGQYTGPIPASAQEYQYAVRQGYKGTFSQYQTEDANRKAVSKIVSDSTPVLPQDTTKALGQLSFLKKTVESAEALKEASGQSGLRTKAGDWFVGGTKYRQLENLNNTLKTNILTMMVDPAVKKFFGPQMTNQDVRLMTAGGTTLNVESQTPEQMQEELTRLKDLFQRAEDAVNEGLGQPSGQMSKQGTPQTPVPQFEGYTLGADGKYYKNK